MSDPIVTDFLVRTLDEIEQQDSGDTIGIFLMISKGDKLIAENLMLSGNHVLELSNHLHEMNRAIIDYCLEK
jgi:hypothetical protein